MTSMFNPNPIVQRVALHDGHECLVVDEALADPAAWVAWACERRDQFRPTGHAYPGLELWLGDERSAQLVAFFEAHLRPLLRVGPVIEAASRASLVTLAPEALAPMQRFCHRDNRGVPEDQCVIASVIYLFDDATLGGTGFYRPRRPLEQVETLVQDSRVLRAPVFEARYPEIARGYMVEGNDWFERVAAVPARFNRAVFYDGGIFHSGAIGRPEGLSDDPARGRFTINGFMRCRREGSGG